MQLRKYLLNPEYIPLDKSWIIRMGILDLINSKKDISRFLDSEQNLGGDLKALKRVIDLWETDKPLEVGESGTIYRFARFYTWKNKIYREIKISDTLINRVKRGAICDSQEIVNWTPEELLKLDNQTSQWATMNYLLGDRRKVENPPFKLKVTYDAVEHWEQQRKIGKSWEAREDPTIMNQALAFINYLKMGKINFSPEQAEDYCFARAFDVISQERGRKLYPSLEGHETPRFDEMEKSLNEVESEKIISSEDHRVVQAIAMRYFLEGFGKRNFAKPNSVNKTWPRFWDFIWDVGSILAL